jgi:hypothetical protein
MTGRALRILILTTIIAMIRRKIQKGISTLLKLSLQLTDSRSDIPKAPRRKEAVPETTLEERVTELRTDLSSTREQFDKKDRARERKLKELEVSLPCILFIY